MNEWRVGRIEVSRKLVLENWSEIVKGFQVLGFLPVWSECDLVADRIKYTGFCEKFDILDRDAMTPFYRVEIEVVQDENGVDHNIYSVRKV